MENNNEETFEYLGKNFQYRLLNQILQDHSFAISILDILSPNYFEDEYLRKIAAIIKDVYEDSNNIPDDEGIQMRIFDVESNEIKRNYYINTIRNINEASTNDFDYIQDRALKFCKQQELKKALVEVEKIVSKGRFEEYDKCVDIIQEALEAGNPQDELIDVFDEFDEAMADDFRDPIPTGIPKLDEIMDGGLSKEELGVVLAPFGVGKTSMMTKLANTAKDMGYNVLQIFFEDQRKVIQRKHYACWSGIDLNELNDYREDIREIVEQKKNEEGILKLRKFSSAGVTIPGIKQYIRKLISQGFTPDMVVLDYIDCVNPSQSYDDIFYSEGTVMREFESMLSELNMAGWTAIQSNREGLGADIVSENQIGGSIKKGQIGHFIMSIAKTLPQKESGRANLAILKSRFGEDGITFNDVKFENSKVNIEIDENSQSSTFLGAKDLNEEKSAQERQRRVNEVLAEINGNGQHEDVNEQNNNQEQNG